MKNEKMYLISEDAYHKHIDDEVHLYGLLHQLAFMTGKVKDAEDVAHMKDTAIRYGQIADELFDGWNIPGRYLVYGDKADLETLKSKELEHVIFDPEDDGEDDFSLRGALEGYRLQFEDLAEILAETVAELDALGGE